MKKFIIFTACLPLITFLLMLSYNSLTGYTAKSNQESTQNTRGIIDTDEYEYFPVTIGGGGNHKVYLNNSQGNTYVRTEPCEYGENGYCIYCRDESVEHYLWGR